MTRAALGTALASMAMTAVTASAGAAINGGSFTVTPSTVAAGAHPDLTVDTQYKYDSSGDTVKDATDSLAAGIALDPSVAPTCTESALNSGSCPAASQVASLSVNGTLQGNATTTNSNGYLMAPHAGEVTRLGFYANVAGVAIVTEAGVVKRGSDGGLDILFTNSPKSVTVGLLTLSVQIQQATLKLNGTVGGKPFVTNPSTCGAATTSVRANSYNAQSTYVSATSAFTPTGCATGGGTGSGTGTGTGTGTGPGTGSGSGTGTGTGSGSGSGSGSGTGSIGQTSAPTGSVSFSGLGGKSPSATVTVSGYGLTQITVKLPAGLKLAKKQLAKAITVTADGKVLKGAVRATGGSSLQITLSGAQKVTIAIRSLVVSKQLHKKVAKHKAGNLTILATVTSASGKASLKLTAAAH
jgi:hypothetical protein